MAESLIGNLAVLLSMNTAAFEEGSTKAQKILRQTQRQFEQVGDRMQTVGKNMSTYLTLPILGAGAAVVKMAGDFETGMNEVKIASGATNEEFKAMRELALDIGATTTKSASESANAMETLAKAGMSTKNILEGGARATVALAEAAGSELEPAAAAITDTMQQFGKTAKDLPFIINNITGAVNESKFDFADFQLGMSQAGGVANSAGLEFEEFTAALAATSSQFASGSDAGTSMKTFLLSLTPSTKKAATAMADAGFTAYTATGQMKPLAQIAEELRVRFGHLSEQDLNATFKQMFGTDAIRTAIGLMKQGEDGIKRMQAAIAATDAERQAAERMKGWNAQIELLKGALETLAIRIADSGMLAAITSLVKHLAGMVDWLAKLSPETLKWITIIAGVTAALGPVVLVLGTMVKGLGMLLPLIVKLGPVFTVLKTVALVLAPALWGITKALAAMALTPLGMLVLAIGGIYLAFKNWDKIGPIVQRVYSAVKTWLLDKFTNIVNGIKAKVQSITGFFRDMWDKVVGHSYVPDMVTAIGEHMARLDGNMVQPAKKGTEAVKQAFADLQQAVQGILGRLFPEEARHLQFVKELKTIEDAAKALKWTAEETAEAIARLRQEYSDDQFGAEPLFGGKSVDQLGSDAAGEASEEIERESERWQDALEKGLAKPAKEKTEQIIQSFRDMSLNVIGSLRYMIDSFKKGDILGALQGILDIVLNVVQTLAQVGIIGKGGGQPIPIAGARARGGPVVGGKTYLVGENGPEWVTPRRNGFVHPNGTGMARSVVEIVPSPYFGTVVDGRAQRVAAPMSARAAVAGAVGAEHRFSRRQRHNLAGR